MKNHTASFVVAALVVASACTATGVQTDPVDTSVAYAGNCNAPQGPIESYTTDDALTQSLVGKWVRCSGPSLLDNEQVGVELDSDGTYHMLGDDGAGGVGELSGFGMQGTWSASLGSLYIHPTENSGEGGGVTLESGPRKLDAQWNYNDEDSMYAIAPY